MLYLYAIVNSAPPLEGCRGLTGEPLSFLSAGPVGAVVSELASAPAPTRESLRGHDEVLRQLSSKVAVLPARFGQLSSASALSSDLTLRAPAFTRALALVDGCVQMTVRLAVAPRPDMDDRPPAASSDDGIGPGRRYLEERRRRRTRPEVEALNRALSPFFRAERRELKNEGERSLASLYHLVTRDLVEPWRAALERERAKSGLRLTTSGPWPPYAFAPEAA